ncbi:PspC domain-containing protein [Bacteroides sp. 51]|uniref:PspC domain-containing protein n=1 Tax=Bacteroides sp. 51 TaxID=2302938 RepID=UPI0013D49C14|nr:PspC domain-containing protein [Bacteroides sp. 51]NDV82917.1 PspC domain-containing protein [Bacteroides sp. 51]
MKKTLTVNLGGTVFHIDEDAYRLLDEYLCNLKLHFRKQEGAEEIINDIETRISELFSEKIGLNSQVITIAHVEEVIERMGKPEEFEDEQDNSAYTDAPGAETKHTSYKEPGKTAKRLYRNPDDKILGGVIGGLAAYFGWDATLLRLVVLIILICGVGTLIPVYIVLWLVIPEAQTAAEKLSMRGEEVTMENIGKTVTDGFEKVANGVNDYMRSDKPRTFLQKLADALVSIIGFILKACLVVLAIIFSPILFVLIIVLVALVIAIISVMIGGGAALYSLMPSIDWGYISASPLVTIIACIAGVIIVGIPLFGIVFAILRQVFNWQPMVSGLKWTLLILWIVGLAVFFLALPQLSWDVPYLEGILM